MKKQVISRRRAAVCEDDQDINEEIALNEEFINVERPIYNYPAFISVYPVNKFMGFNLLAMLSELYLLHFKPSKECGKKMIFNRLPCLKWIRNYDLKRNFLADLLAGMTVGM